MNKTIISKDGGACNLLQDKPHIVKVPNIPYLNNIGTYSLGNVLKTQLEKRQLEEIETQYRQTFGKE